MNKIEKMLIEEIKSFCETNNLFFNEKNEIIYSKNEFFLFYIICDFKPSCCEIGIYFTPLFITQEDLTLTFGNTIPFLTGKLNLEVTYSLNQNKVIKRLNKNLSIALKRLNKWSNIITPDFIIHNINRAKHSKMFYTEELWKWELLGYCYAIVGDKDKANSMFLKLIDLFSNNHISDWQKTKLNEWENALKIIDSNNFDDFIRSKIKEMQKQFFSNLKIDNLF